MVEKCNLIKAGTLELEGAGQSPWHTGIVCLPEDRLLLVDSPAYNIRLYSIDTGHLLATSQRLQSQPWSIGMLDNSGSQIAVALWNGTIQILSVQSNEGSTAIRSVRTLATEMMKCYSVCSITPRNELVVTGPYKGYHCFSVLSSSGEMLVKICKICKYGGLASFLATSKDELSIYISCSVCHDSPDNGVYGYNVLSRQRKFKYRRNLTLPRGICVDSKGYIYVCDQNTNRIHQMTEEGEPVAVFGELEEIPAEPVAICLNESRHELFVTRWARNEVLRFQLIHGRTIPAEILRMDEEYLQMYKEALQDGTEKIYDIRVMVVGNCGVGKTTLTKRLLGEEVNISEWKSTEGIDVRMHCCRVSLDTWEWTTRHKEAEKYARLQRLARLLNDRAKKRKVSDIQEGHMDVIYQRDTTSELDVSANIEDCVTEANYLSTTLEPDVTGSVASNVLKPERKRKDSSGSEGKDQIVELLQMVNENAAELNKSRVDYAGLTVMDFAGQYVFYTTHQMFLTSRAIYLLVTDLNQHLSDLVTDNDCFFDSEGIKLCKVHEFVEVWLNSIHSIAPFPTAGIPPVVLVGTHLDKIPEESRQVVIDGYFQQIRSILKDQPTRFHLANDDFAIDNTVLDHGLEELKRKIIDLASKQSYWGEEVPARWLLLEQAIMTLKSSGIKVVPLNLVKELNQGQSVLIETDKELDLFLRFQHEKGILIYFSFKGLNEKIVLDPKWLIDALKSLITAKMFIHRNNPAIIEKWGEFEKNGKLTPELISAVWTKENNLDFHENKEHILKLMAQLNIIAKPRSFNESGDEVKVENFYIVPCMLRQATPKEVISPELSSEMESTSVLCCVLTEKFLQSPVFHPLLAACMVQWPVAKKTSEHLIFCGCSVFELDRCHRLILHFRNHVIFVRITRIGKKVTIPVSKLCIEVREHIDKTLSHIIGYLFRNLQFQWYIQCPRSEVDCFESMIPVSEMKETAELMCKFHADHVIESRELCKFWFETETILIKCRTHCNIGGLKTSAVQCIRDISENPISCYPLDLQDKRPSDQQLSRLSLRIGQELHTLGLELGISEAEIQQIQIENPFVATQCFMILFKWAHRNVDQTIFRNLERALRNVGADIEILKTLNEADDFVSCLSPEVLDTRPTEQELKKISGHIGKEFVHLGVELGIHLTRIEQIRLEHPRSVARQSLEILFVWRGTNEGQDTFRNLERAFRCARMDVNILSQVLQT